MSTSERFAIGAGRERPAHAPRSLNCPNCGAGLTVQDEHAELVVCSSCTSHLDLSAADAAALTQPVRDREWGFPLAIGDRWQHEGISYTVVARMALIEPDSKPTLQYLLFNPSLGGLWASEYDGDWSLFRSSRLMPLSGDPFALDEGERITTGDRRRWRKAEGGTLELAWIDGALPWQAKLGDRIEYAEFSGDNQALYEAQRTSKEVEYGEGRNLTAAEVATATGNSTPDAAASGGPGGSSGDGGGKSFVRRIGCLFFAAMMLIIAFGLFAAMFSSIDPTVRQYAEETLQSFTRSVSEFEGTRKRFDDLVATAPALLGDDAQSWRKPIDQRAAQISQGSTAAEQLNALLETDSGLDDSDVLTLANQLSERLSSPQELGEISVLLERLATLRGQPEKLLAELLEIQNAAVKRAVALSAVLTRAQTDWPEQRDAIVKRSVEFVGLRDRAEADWSNAEPARAAVPSGNVSDEQLRALFDAYRSMQKLDLAAQDAKMFAWLAELYWAREVILVDMDAARTGRRLRFRQELRTVSLRANASPGSRSSADNRRWREVRRARFLQQDGGLGMTLLSKPLGRFNNQAVSAIAPPGYTFICGADCDRNDFGRWVSDAQGKYWQFAPNYDWIRAQLWPPNYRITPEDYSAWTAAVGGGTAYRGGNGSSTGQFGSTAATVLALYAASTFVRRGGYNVPAMERSLRQDVLRARAAQESYRRSTSSGSRSGGGK